MSDLSKRLKNSFFCQRFSLPEDTIVHIAMNPPSPEVYNKLIQCCKYFRLKNPIITLNYLCPCSSGKYSRKYWRTHKVNGFSKRQKIKIKTLNEKLWVDGVVKVSDDRKQSKASSMIQKIYRCDLTRLSLSNQSLLFDEFRKFTSSGTLEMLFLHETVVKNDDGTIVPIEKLIELLQKLQTCYYDNFPSENGLLTITSETAANLNAIPHFSKIENFTMTEIPESFNFEAFFATPKVMDLVNARLINEFIYLG